jgi:hypothetical protein
VNFFYNSCLSQCSCQSNGQLACTLRACVPAGCKAPDGTIVPVGGTFKNDCNTCTCGENGVAACTKIGCLPDECSSVTCDYCTKNLSPIVNPCCARLNCPTTGGCKAPGGTIVPVGGTFKNDCNTCTCGENGVAGCTEIACPPPTNGCKAPDGTIVPVGGTFKNDCNTCTCGENGVAACTKIGCLPDDCAAWTCDKCMSTPTLALNACCTRLKCGGSSTDGCKAADGTVVPVGKTFTAPDGCNTVSSEYMGCFRLSLLCCC